ncbi:MAG: LysM peptidoglycan-binding domain-containing protein [Thiomonas sp.]
MRFLDVLPLRRYALLLAVLGPAAASSLALAQTTPLQASADTSPSWQYTVRPGDTLIALGRRYLRDPSQWPVVRRDNRIANPRHIRLGTVLLIRADLLCQAPSSA